MAKNPPVFKVPPAPAGKGGKGSAWQQFVNKWAAKYPSLKANAPDILSVARLYGVDPIYFASVLLTESGANYNTKDSSAGAIGIGQVMPLHVGEQVPWDPTSTVTLADLRSPGFNLRFSGYYLAQQVGKYGYAHAYDQGYNPGYTGSGPQQFISGWNKQYVPQPGKTSPAGPAGEQVPGGTAPASVDVKDPYVVLGKGGQVSFVNSTGQVPKNSLNWFGLPMTRSQFLQYWNQLDNTYIAYTGKRASMAQVAQTVQHGWSTTQVQLKLAEAPQFKNSPVWKQNAPSYTAAWQNIYGQGSTPDPKALRYAIVHNMDMSAFENSLRNRTDYGKSQEFKKKAADNSGQYTQIYGVPGENGNRVINEATKNGYTPQQFAVWLRQQPQYTSSDEFKSSAMSWAKSMGLLSSAPGLEANASLSTAATPSPAMATKAPYVPPDARPTPPPELISEHGAGQNG